MPELQVRNNKSYDLMEDQFVCSREVAEIHWKHYIFESLRPNFLGENINRERSNYKSHNKY